MHDGVDDGFEQGRWLYSGRSTRPGSLRAATCMLRRAKATAWAICRFNGPVTSCASIWPEARSLPRYGWR